MTGRPRSLKHEYELYVDRELENYKESVSRSMLLSIGDAAVTSLGEQQQLALTEILLCDEVDRIIRQRLRIPSFATWQRRRLKVLKEYRRPERWGLNPNGPLVREVPATSDLHVLVAGASEGPALYLAANGCAVTAVDPAAVAVERVINTAVKVGLTGRVRGFVTDLGSWSPDIPINAVVCTPLAFSGLSARERARVFALLQRATTDGGVHLLETVSAGQRAISIEELRMRYRGWEVSVERSPENKETFLARKAVA